MKKSESNFLLKFFLSVVIVLILTETSFALGISPAKVEMNFAPGMEKTIEYSVFGNAGQELELYVVGELAEYIQLDKSELVGGGKFNLKLKLPESLEKSGKLITIVGVKEKIDEELRAGTIGTSVIIQVLVIVNVPYPGKYLELALKSHDVNVGESVNLELEIASKGKENVIVTPLIEIVSQNKTIETLYFKNREIKSQEKITLYKTLDTTNYNPGKYNAVAIVDYGKIVQAESGFKIGELVISVTNYTKQIIIDKVKSFYIEIESGWNNQIDGAYAEVFILNDSKSLISFKTSSTKLTPWEKKTITGFFDTSNFTEGFYDANITLFYYGKEIGKSSSELVEIEFIEEPKQILIVFVVVGIIILLIVAILLIKKYLFKSKKRK